jgi:hypothetical protein
MSSCGERRVLRGHRAQTQAYRVRAALSVLATSLRSSEPRSHVASSHLLPLELQRLYALAVPSDVRRRRRELRRQRFAATPQPLAVTVDGTASWSILHTEPQRACESVIRSRRGCEVRASLSLCGRCDA